MYQNIQVAFKFKFCTHYKRLENKVTNFNFYEQVSRTYSNISTRNIFKLGHNKISYNVFRSN